MKNYSLSYKPRQFLYIVPATKCKRQFSYITLLKAIMKETEIRPAEYLAIHEKACADDQIFLLSEKNRWTHVPCPACVADDYNEFGTKNGGIFVKCRKCATIYINPRPSEELLHEYYSNSKAYEVWNTYIFPASDEKRRKNIYTPRADILIEYCRKAGIHEGASLLEVGAGFGSFCDVVRQKGFFGNITAVEPTPQLAKSCQELGLNVISDFAENAIQGNKCDVFCSFEVIEHIFNPYVFLKSAFEVISENGIIVLSCPNPKGFDLGTLGLIANNFDLEHLNYFHPDSIKQLLERVGFKDIEIITPGKLDVELVRNAAIQNDTIREKVKEAPFFQQLLFEKVENVRDEFQAFLAKHGFSSHMIAVATKKSK